MENKNKFLAIGLSLIIFLPLIVWAVDDPCASSNGLIPSDECIKANGFSAFSTMINTIINWFISISATVAAITFSIAGAQMLLNPDNPGKRQDAIEMFKKTVIGLLIILGAWLVIHTVISTLVKSDKALRFFN